METSRSERFDALARECLEPLRRYLARRTDPETAADVLGDTLLVAWRRFDDVPADALPWLYGVARNCLANAERGVRRRARLAARLTVEPAAAEAPEMLELHEALEGLGDTERELVRLWAWEQLTPAEIATVTGLTPNAVSIRLTRARQRLREQLARKTGDPAGHELA
ncbi:RNA polymerase sigma-70 factor, ECF subfamily [Nocardioides terrae]|uniref:RNA polymerase sigma-70 factor, ECF subfamily n=1 Tax=Nocardioides terrae TaxID=574651 RepID=A0A1I1MUX7_9ACTN|nr:sigma-70 family RNA polymerase sigma factor [Nocardioides terrae]SFC89224.1 RNA polymerase sigma-70 factor, ECF subfamily [Nocardioides terrae]